MGEASVLWEQESEFAALVKMCEICIIGLPKEKTFTLPSPFPSIPVENAGILKELAPVMYTLWVKYKQSTLVPAGVNVGGQPGYPLGPVFGPGNSIIGNNNRVHYNPAHHGLQAQNAPAEVVPVLRAGNSAGAACSQHVRSMHHVQGRRSIPEYCATRTNIVQVTACDHFKRHLRVMLHPFFRAHPSRGCIGFKFIRPSFLTTNTQSISTTMATASKKVLVPIGTGSEEMEAVITIDVLRRAGAQVTVASVEPALTVKCSRGVNIVADKLIDECVAESFDLIALPGGMPGAERLRDSEPLFDLLDKQAAAGKLHAAICATPAVALETRGFLKGKKATVHPAFADKLGDASEVSKRVVVDHMLTTSRGPGTAFEFALSLVKQLYGEERMKEVAGPMVMYDGWQRDI